ncbi:MAG: response regulator [Hyphomicrobiales bacterium]|nr:MAG: response regulator [Hyphomicrobiales bacterium]
MFARRCATGIIDVWLGSVENSRLTRYVLCWNGWRLFLGRLFEDGCAGAGDMGTQANVLIIEDEPMIAADLTYIVEELGLHVIGVAKTSAEAVALAKLASVSLVLSDMRLADGSSGARAVEQILQEQVAAVIFITGCAHLVPTSMRESAFVITKPYRETAVKVTIEQALSRRCDCPKLRACACPAQQYPV